MVSCRCLGDGGYCTQTRLYVRIPTNRPVDIARISGGTFPTICCLTRPVPVTPGDMPLRIVGQFRDFNRGCACREQ